MNQFKNMNISNILKEIIEPDTVDVSSIQMHETLCPLIWDESEMLKSEVRKTLLLNAKRFIEFADVEELNYSDIILTGSMANYNYNENSDLDVHILLDYDQVSPNTDFVRDFFKLKKQLWAEKLPIQVKGHDVEMYIQDSKEPHHSTGTYSLMRNEWIKKPLKKIVNIDTTNLKLKSADFMNAIDDLSTNKDSNNFLKKYNQIKDKIKKYRQTGLETNGEYSTENLVFKILRNTGFLGKMVGLKNDYLTQELTLNEFDI